jgi:hypothetical protein
MPSAEEAATWGLTVEEACGPPVEIWPCMISSINVFISMSTQWTMGHSGPIGLNYVALPVVMRLVGVPAKDRAEVFDDIRTMEDVALQTIRESK